MPGDRQGLPLRVREFAKKQKKERAAELQLTAALKGELRS
jgi:hypothetical protein